MSSDCHMDAVTLMNLYKRDPMKRYICGNFEVTEIGHLCLGHLAPRNSDICYTVVSGKCMVGLIAVHLKISMMRGKSPHS